MSRRPPTRRIKTSRWLLMEPLESRLAPATFYVSNSGNNASNGSAGTPWQTLQYAADHLQAGDTVIVRAGTYVGFDLQTDGTAFNRITFSAEQGVLINQRNARTTDGINLEGADYVTIEGFNISGIARAGIRSVVNQHVIIRNNQAHQNGRWGIFTGFSDDILIEGNTCTRSVAEHGIYVSNSGDRPIIRNNVLWGNAACGIHMNGDISQGGDGIISGALVEGNVIYENGANGGSGINGDGVQNSVFRNNLLFNNHASGISLYCIDGAAGSRNNLLINNTVIVASNGRWALNIQSGSTGNTVLNNILYNQHATRGSIDISADSLTGFRSDYNVVMNRFTRDGGTSILTLATWRSQTGNDQHSLVATPSQLFVDAANNDYHLSATSLALNAGTTENAPTADYEGTVRPSGGGIDIGADERLQTTTWGNVAFYLLGGQGATGDTTYTATATRTGTFTAEVLFAHTGGNVDLEVYDASNQLLGSSATANSGERVDVAVTAGQVLRIRVIGVNANVTFRGTNLLTASGDTVTLGATTADELFVFLPGSTTTRIAVNGVGYDFASNSFDNYIVQGGGGADTTVVVGTSAAETATFSAGGVNVSSVTFAFSASASEFNTVNSNGGGDVGTFSDTTGNDTFSSSPTQGVMSGAGYSNTANGFATVTGAFSAGGYDQAFLYGSIGDDRFEAGPTTAFLQGPGFRLNTSGYDTVVGVGGWGNDIALLADSGGDETFIGQADAGSLSNSNFYLRAANFERVEARSSAGFDVAYLWDSAGDDYFGGSKVLAFLNGTGFSNYVESFDRVTGLSTGGNDTADMYGAAGADQFFSNGRSRRIQAADYLVQTENFRTVRAYGGAGADTAELQDLLSSHRITGRANWFRLSSADTVTGYDFEQVTAVARTGQRPVVDVAAIDYAFTRVGF